MSEASCRARLSAVVLTLFLLSACGTKGPAPVGSRELHGPAPAGYYRIQPGDTLGTIAVRYSVDRRELARWNELEPPYRIRTDKLIRIEPPRTERPKTAAKKMAKAKAKAKATTDPTPNRKGKTRSAKRTAKTATRSLPAKRRAKTASKKRGTKAVVSGLNWRWPLRGRLMRTFRRGDPTRQGIRILGHAGAEVVAVEAGKVVYSGSGLKGYGNLIIIKHNNDYLSAYGFNRRLLAAEGVSVSRGQSVAEVGQSVGGEYLLHFEIRRHGSAVDPLDYLPASP